MAHIQHAKDHAVAHAVDPATAGFDEVFDRLLDPEQRDFASWRVFLDRVRSRQAGELVLTTFAARPGLARKDIDARAKIEATGGVDIGEELISFTTIAKQDCKMTLGDLPAAEGLVLHVLASFPSNVERNFYVAFAGEARESLRFANSEVALAESAAVHEGSTREPALYTLALSPSHVSLYVNGVLEKRKRRSSRGHPTEVLFELIGHESADLGAGIHGFELWALPAPFAGFGDAASDELPERLDALLEEGDLTGVHEFLVSFDDFDITPVQERLHALLEQGLEEERGFREWIYEDVLARVPAETAAAWRHEWQDRMPVPQLEISNLTVRFYRMPHERLSLARMIRRREAETFDVLKGISLKAYRGDILGIVGANGAGKSTLLRAVAGLLPIREGEIILRGQHLLLSPGLGIRNELSARENILLAGSFMGLSRRDINAIYEDIVTFSELAPYIDMPFKFYSDGMKSRLIFSIATAVAPDILMLDELLSAGDIAFQQKAARRMDEMIERSKVVIVITHSMPFVVDKCNKALLISHGRPIIYGPPKTVVARFYNELHLPQPETLAGDDGLNVTMMQQMAQQSSMPAGGLG